MLTHHRLVYAHFVQTVHNYKLPSQYLDSAGKAERGNIVLLATVVLVAL